MGVPDLSDRPLEELISLRGRRAVVTGGARGLGRAIAHRLAEAGASVLIGDIDQAAAKRAAEDVASSFGVSASSIALDVSESASVSAAADAAVARLGGIDVWVNNAGIFPSVPLLHMTDDDWDRVLKVNLRGTFVGCREAARRMISAGGGGVIINISSVAGFRGRSAGVAHYVASKHGVIGLTRQVAVELAEHGIRVLAVSPTTIITPGVESAMSGAPTHSPPDLEEALTRPLGRAGRPDDVARVVLFCASDLSMFMTGSSLLVDAGELAR
ncbi:MAG TPA: SDR family NAD(P)-dependent oxidoreductase [Acidimicrobiales bacterium]|nr:SDR family NAD(P)-dependent oxidoreductase [Acidimicrobiales bacterium]